MAQAIPYLGFDGTCAEAMRWYEQTLGLGARLEMLVRMVDMPGAAEQIPKEFHERIVHARLRFSDGSYLYGGDAPPHHPFPGIKGVSITMNYPTAAEAERVFAALSAGGSVLMPLAESSWATRFGMLTDRFGTPWTLNGELHDGFRA